MTEDKLDNEKINRFFKGDYTEKDAQYLEDVFCDKQKEVELEYYLKKQWYEFLKENSESDRNLDPILNKIHYNINTNLQKPESTFSTIYKWFTRIAAVFLIPLAIYFWIHFLGTVESGNLNWVEIKAPAWTQAKFSLPDGSVVCLNSNSSIKYNNNFKFKRELTLDGEAFFDITKDKKKPFKVNTGEIILTVLGTKFNVASYENENNIEVVLEEGKLIFSNKKMNRSCLMKPNDLITYNKKIKDYTSEVVQTEKYSSWKDGKLVFRNDPLDIIARRLERWYNIKVEIKGDDIVDLRLRATFINENLDEVLYFLKRSLPIDYNIKMGEIDRDDKIIKKKVTITINNQNAK